jgi:hypothetical protein
VSAIDQAYVGRRGAARRGAARIGTTTGRSISRNLVAARHASDHDPSGMMERRCDRA